MTYQEQAYNALTTRQQDFVKVCVLKQINRWGKVYADDLNSYVITDLCVNAKGFDWRKVADHTQAACWDMEASGQITRTMKWGRAILTVA